MTRTLPRAWRWGVVGLYTLMLLFLSTIPGDPGGSGGVDLSLLSLSFLNDKVLHFMAYFPLGWALALTGARGGVMLVVGAGLAALDEGYQSLIPGRMPDGWDWLADMAGITAGWLVEYLFKGRCRKAR